MATQNTRPTFWIRWRRGFSALWRAYLLLFTAYIVLYLPAALGGAALDSLGEPWRVILGVIFGLVWFTVLVIFLPVMVSGMQMDPASIKEELAREIEPRIDTMGRELGVQWEEHYISQVGKLLENGKSVEARQCYHDHSGATWDEVDQALATWSTTVMKDKLKILQEAIRGDKEPVDSPTA